MEIRIKLDEKDAKRLLDKKSEAEKSAGIVMRNNEFAGRVLRQALRTNNKGEV